MLALALALAAQQSPSGDLLFRQANRGRVEAAMVQAQAVVSRIGHCAGRRPDQEEWDRDYDAVLRRLADVFVDAEELYREVNPVDGATILATDPSAPTCSDAQVRTDLAAAGRALDEAGALIRADSPARANGLWLGTLRLCGDRVESVGEGEPEFEGDSRPVIVHFSPAFAPRVHRLTAAFVRRRLPVILNGTVVVRPTVNEPVSWGISINAPDRPPLEQFRRAAAMPC